MNEDVDAAEIAGERVAHRRQRRVVRNVAFYNGSAAELRGKLLHLALDALALIGERDSGAVFVELARDARGDRPAIRNAGYQSALPFQKFHVVLPSLRAKAECCRACARGAR